MAIYITKVKSADVARAWCNTELFMADAAASVGMSVDCFRDRAYALGLPKRRPGPRQVIRPRQEAEFRLMWRAGVSARQIGRYFDCSYFAVINTARRLNLTMRGVGYKPGFTLDAFCELRLGVAMRAGAARVSTIGGPVDG